MRFGAIEFMGDELTEPAQNRVRARRVGDVFERFAAHSVTDLRKSLLLRVGKPQAALDLGLEDPVFGSQVFVAKQ